MRVLPSNANVLRYNCEKSGCFNLRKRPKIEYFYDCFPGKIGMGDVDGSVEINWNFLYLEWKPRYEEPSGGQALYHLRRTAKGESTTFYVCGDAQTMEISHYGTFWKGNWSGLAEANFDQLHARIKSWSDWARKNPNWPGAKQQPG